MAGKFSKGFIISEEDYDGGEIHLRRPTAPEINAFNKKAYPTGKKGFLKEERDPVSARVDYFDLLFTKIIGFADDDDIMIPENGKDQIPEDEKNHIIITYVESRERVDTKN